MTRPFAGIDLEVGARAEPEYTHVLVVTDLGPDWVYHGLHRYDVEVSHRNCTGRGDDCIVDSSIREMGIGWVYHGSVRHDDWPVPTGAWVVYPWTSKFDVPGEPIEYDSGVSILTVPPESPELQAELALLAGPECTCAMTEGSQRRCPVHGEEAPE